MIKRGLMLTAATAALLSGQSYAATPCNSSTSTSSLCDIITEVTTPLYTGSVPSSVTNGVGNLSSITIDTDGSLVITTSPPTAPAMTIDSGTSSSPAIVTNVTNITYTGVSYAVGVLLEEASAPGATGYGTAENWTGEFINSLDGVINLTGAGTNKIGILIAGAADNGTTTTGFSATDGLYANVAGSSTGPLGVFTGAIPSGASSPVAINLATTSTLEVQGTASYGIDLIGPSYTTNSSGVITPVGGATLIGDIDIGGAVTLTPTTADSTTATGNIAVLIAGWEQSYSSSVESTNPSLAGTAYANTSYAMIGNLNIVSGATITSEGQGSEGVVILGPMDGAINNGGTILTEGTTTPSTAVGADDAEGGSALIVANNITGGINNEGRAVAQGYTATPSAEISTVGDAPAVVISPSGNGGDYYVPITIGAVTTDPDYPNQFSLVNRGVISAASEDSNFDTEAIDIAGVAGSPVTFTNGIFNSGAITATATTNTERTTTSVTATAITIGNYVTIGTGQVSPTSPEYSLINTDEDQSGTIVASVAGPDTGVATAILISAPGTAAGSGGTLTSLFNSGTISADAVTTTLTENAIAAYAIDDQAGTLRTIMNQGTISAISTILDNDNQVAIAIDVQSNQTTPVTITDEGTSARGAAIQGDIDFGALPGTLDVIGFSAADPATVTGNIYFNDTCTSASTTGLCGALSDKNDTLMIGPYGTVTGEIQEAGKVGSVDITIEPNGTLNLLTTTPTNVNSTVTTSIAPGTPLTVGTLCIGSTGNDACGTVAAPGGVLDESLSQGFNVNVNPGVSVIDAQNVAIGNPIGTIQPIQITFGSFIATPTNKSPTNTATFVLIQSATNIAVSAEELTALGNSLQPGAPNAIPFLFAGNICTYNVANSPIACSGTEPEPINSNASEIVLNIAPKTAQELGLTGYAAQMFKYANEALVNDNTLGAAMINGIKNAPQAQATYASFAPDVSGATRATAISLTDSATGVVASRQRELTMFMGQEGETTLWGQQFGERLSQNNGTVLTGYNDSGFGFVLGADEGDPTDGRYGAAFTFFGGGMSQKAPLSDKTASEYYLLTGYTNWRGTGVFFDTQLTVGYGNLKGKRYLSIDGVNREADGDRPTELVATGATLGGILNAGGTVFIPQFSVDGLAMREEAYTESNGGEGFDLRVQPYYANSLRTFLGADVRQDVNFGDFFLQPDFRFGYRYDFLKGAVKLKANFASVNVNDNPDQTYDPFIVEGPDPGRGNLVLGAGLATTTGSWSIGINYDYVRTGNGATEQVGFLNVLGRI